LRCDKDISAVSVDMWLMLQQFTNDLTAKATTIDVRKIERPMRHPLIFDKFDRMCPDESFCIVSDHNPRPLRYLFDVKFPGGFTWEYVEEGPDVWRVRIGRAAEAPALSPSSSRSRAAASR
jgi:uncharacterized protein (DUF2249 family)